MQLRRALAKLPLPGPRKVSVRALCSCTSGKQRREVSQHTHCKKCCADRGLTSKRKETGFQDLLHKFSAETLPPKISRTIEVLAIRSRPKYQISGTACEYRTTMAVSLLPAGQCRLSARKTTTRIMLASILTRRRPTHRKHSTSSTRVPPENQRSLRPLHWRV